MLRITKCKFCGQSLVWLKRLYYVKNKPIRTPYEVIEEDAIHTERYILKNKLKIHKCDKSPNNYSKEKHFIKLRIKIPEGRNDKKALYPYQELLQFALIKIMRLNNKAVRTQPRFLFHEGYDNIRGKWLGVNLYVMGEGQDKTIWIDN